MHTRTIRRYAIPSLLLALAGCMAPTTPTGGSPDGRDEVGVTAGKADGTPFTECELEAVVVRVNDPSTSARTLKDAGVHSRASNNIIEHRNGDDGEPDTEDDSTFEGIEQIDDVYYVGPVAIRQLVDAIADQCVDPAGDRVEVIFSPQPYFSSHLARTASLIDDAEESIDVAMYSFRDHGILEALQRAVERGVSVRVSFDSASEDRRDPEGTMSATLEESGMEVRWVNKVMHHKFAIIDGVRTAMDDPSEGILVSGSGNWSHSAGTRYEENTLIIREPPELLLRFQREFNHLWAHSREVVWNEDIEYFESVEIDESSIPDDPAVDAVFTSANFRTYFSDTYGHTFSIQRGERAGSEALAEKAAEDPSIDIRVYLDGQEWISEWYHGEQTDDLEECIEEAGDSEAQYEDCIYGGFYFGYQMYLDEIPVRYKYYAFRWDYHYAEQMHHKYFVIDGRWVATGSYNLSDNAETNTMENIIILDGAQFPGIADAFEDEFERMWVTGEEEGLYDVLLDEVRHGTDDFPIVFEPMALDWERVDVLKDAIRDACPDIYSDDFRENPEDHHYCPR